MLDLLIKNATLSYGLPRAQPVRRLKSGPVHVAVRQRKNTAAHR